MAAFDVLADTVKLEGQPAQRGEMITFGGVHMEKYSIRADTVLLSHCHTYDHPSILASGMVEMWRSDREGLELLDAPAEVTIPAGIKHAIHAVTDAVWYCLHVGEPQIQGDA